MVAGFREHKNGDGPGSLMLGLYDDEGNLHNLGVASSFSVARRAELRDELAPVHHRRLVDAPVGPVGRRRPPTSPATAAACPAASPAGTPRRT